MQSYHSGVLAQVGEREGAELPHCGSSSVGEGSTTRVLAHVPGVAKSAS